ncbi:hypothetical protein AAZX31_04G127800 [Glycine max]|uniref:Glutaredoxin domain-containing protein n=2 Tax=Glycine subgen. Soja TaxID=1462606 RepID=I1JWF4_SOYBN|nr:uncharacterized protein At5g39865 [Glycine max]XP_028228787.1 uncharacterized protein At5g39865-like [Glycine soja]KAG5035075.1 hypothetical protein JHK87_009985 [Glycine soja]KAG5049234.1 hypothetical protein JHK85_010337 [Glycine max]KAG5066385.1 hypothetical protein JHK86_010116 [Glycine max]KAH1111315.1 hypothetical protein GYH30_009905 [Glycine max]KHN33980.1 Hypothetical protein glysoja_045734 [Glycine soja]|eukprot:XP_003522948.1 uncharacterized protein At5g39865 [Glycine max]
MSRFPFFNRSNTIHSTKSESSQKPYLVHHHLHNLDRSGSVNRFYGSVDSMKSSIRGKMVKKLCTLFESSKKPLPEPESESESFSSSKSRSKTDSDSCITILFRLPGTEDRIVVYLTSLRGIRRTFEDCNAVRMILKGFRVWVDERDVSMDLSYREELQHVLGEHHVALPQVFIRGKYIGGADVIKHLFESGDLAKMILEGLPKLKPGFVCDNCGDARFVPCENCSGSRKVFDEDEGELKRCLECNENGLLRCPYCCS